MAKLLGFSFIRNGLKYDYPFVESITSLSRLCEDTSIVVGDSEDETLREVQKISKLTVSESVWDPKMMGDGGQVLSFQTNLSLDRLRNKYEQEEDAWGIYLQGDEVLHEDDYDVIKKDIAAAQRGGYDAISFRYWHFWLSHNKVAVSKRWYPQEVRAIKLKSSIKSHGDAQGFSGIKKCYQSDAFIYHYGHVRDKEKREAKQKLLMEMIRPKDKLSKYLKREKNSFSKTKTLDWFGRHPSVMKERIEKMGDIVEKNVVDKVEVYDPDQRLSPSFFDRICAQDVQLVEKNSLRAISYKKYWCEFFWVNKKNFEKMESEQALPWPLEIQVALKLYQRGVGLR